MHFQQNVVANGTFDANAGSWIGANIGAQGGWSATVANPDGHFILDSTGDVATDPRLCQTLTGLVTGRVYEIAGDYTSFLPAAGDPAKSDAFAATINGSPVLELPRPNPATTWASFARQFVASEPTATLCVQSERDGDDSSFRIDNISVLRKQLIIVITPSAPNAGGPLNLEASLPSGLQVDQLQVFYRMSGQQSYSSAAFVIGSTVGTVSIPAPAITSRGIEYYLALTSGQGVTTIPQTDPENNPIRIRVDVAQQFSPTLRPNGQYQMVSVPLQLTDATPSAIFEDDFGPYAVEDWRLLRWVDGGLPDVGAYVEAPDISTPLSPGTAFWLAHRDSTRFDIDNGISIDASQPFELQLQPGWNQIASPFDFPVAWASITNSDQVQEPVAFDGIEYQYQQTTLSPWAGYFVFNPEAVPVSLFVPPTESSAARKSTTGQHADNSWLLQISGYVDGTEFRDTQNLIGFDGRAKEGLDRNDLLEAPGIGERLRVSIVEDEVRYAKNVKPLTADGAFWDIEVEFLAPNDLIRAKRDVNISVRIPGVRSSESDAWEVAIVDRRRRVSYAHGEPVKLRLAPSERPATLRVMVGTRGYVEKATEVALASGGEHALLPGYPNPFDSEIRLEYLLEEPQNVNLAIYDVLGRRVRLLKNNDENRGLQVTRWDGRDDSDSPVADGVYFVRLRTPAFTAVQDIVLVR